MKIRIGKDINIRWEILTDGEPRPLEGRTLALYIQDYTRRRTEIPFTIAGNALLVSLRAAQLTRLGEYVLTLVENEDEEGQTAVDAKPAFTLVEYTTEEDDSPAAPELDVEYVRLDTANLVRTAGGIQPEELFAGKPVVMEKGDIVPVMRDGQLRPVRVPGTLNGKFRGVIHKAVPIHPRAGMAYVFRGNRLAFKTNSEIFVEHVQRLKETFLVEETPTEQIELLYSPKSTGTCFYGNFEYVLSILDEVDVHLIFIDDSPVLVDVGSYDRTTVLYIVSDGESTNSVNFRFDTYYATSNRLEMVSENYIVSGRSVLFTGLPILKHHSKGKDFDILRLVKRSIRWNQAEKTHDYVTRRGWRRILDGPEKTKFDKTERFLNYRIVRYETKNRNRRSIRFIELRGSELLLRVGVDYPE